MDAKERSATSIARLDGRFPLARLATLLLVLLAGAVLAACGGEDEEEQAADDTAQIEEVALGYGESDGAEACEFMSASALDQLGGESGCTRQFEEVPPAEFEILDVTIEGDTATAAVENVQSEMEIELGFVQEEDEWKLSSFPGLGGLEEPPEDLVPEEGELTEPPEEDEPPEDEEPPPEDEEPPPEDEEPPPEDETAPEE